MKIERISSDSVPLEVQDKCCDVKICGHVIEVKQMTHRNCKQNIKLIPNTDTYEVCSTGEIKQKVTHEKRVDDISRLRKTFSDLRDKINTNVDDVSCCRWVTLTYAENMTDTKKLYKDFDKFIKRFRYYCNKNNYGDVEYINAIEPQGRGAWHCHLLFIFEGKAPYISNADLKDLWSHGFVKIKKLDDVDNVGAYLTSYLTDLELDNSVVINDDSIKNVNGKKIKKGARLNMYPSNMRVWRSSRGLKNPEKLRVSPHDLEKYIGPCEPTYQKMIHLFDDSFESLIYTRYYNLKRSK